MTRGVQDDGCATPGPPEDGRHDAREQRHGDGRLPSAASSSPPRQRGRQLLQVEAAGALLIAEVWLEAAASCQRDVLAALDRGDGLGAALAVPRWVRTHPLEARVLLLHRREELVGREWPAPVRARAREMTTALDRGVAGFIRRIGRGAAVARRVRFALLDVPYAAVRRDVAAGVPPPPDLDALIRSTWGAVMGGSAEGVAK